MKEIWKDIEDYEGLYQVSNTGKVRSLDRIDDIGRKIKGRILADRFDKKGYLSVALNKNAKTKYKKVHRLVAEAFIPNLKKLPQINHKNEIKTDNNVGNLEWCSNKYNANYGTKVDRMLKTRGQERKIKRPDNRRKKVIQYDLNGNFIKIWNSATEVKQELKIHNGDIGKCCKGKHKTAGGYKWKYADD